VLFRSVTYDSKIDFLHYQVTAYLLDEQQWTTSDEDTKTKLSLTPRINEDNTVSCFCTFTSKQNEAKKIAFRTGGSSRYPFDLTKLLKEDNGPTITIEAHALDR